MIPRIRPMKLKGRTGVLVRTPFSAPFNDTLKAMVPRGDRWWNEAATGWWVSERHAPVVQHLVREHFGNVEITDAEGETVTYTRAGEKLHQESLPL